MIKPGANLIAHRISGSFHWQLKLNYLRFGNSNFGPSYSTVFLDTGTTLIIMNLRDWDNLYTMVCDELAQSAKCYKSGPFNILKLEEPDSFMHILKPIRVQIDNVEYEIPFDRFWIRLSVNTYVLFI